VYGPRFISTNPGGTGGFVYFSDQRLKQNIRAAKFAALGQVLATPIRQFEWTASGDTEVGFVAQEVPADAQVRLSPDSPVAAVTDPVCVSAERMLVILWKAVQEIAAAAR